MLKSALKMLLADLLKHTSVWLNLSPIQTSG